MNLNYKGSVWQTHPYVYAQINFQSIYYNFSDSNSQTQVNPINDQSHWNYNVIKQLVKCKIFFVIFQFTLRFYLYMLSSIYLFERLIIIL